MSANLHAERARAVKVAKLVATARECHYDAAWVAKSEGARRVLVHLTGVNCPSDETWAQVVLALKAAEEMDFRFAAIVRSAL